MLAPVVHAQPSADARAQAGAAFKRALAAEKRQDWRAAVREYETAYQLSPHPDVLYNLAGVHERLGELRTAADAYQRYLDGSPDAADRAKVVGKLAELRAHPSVVRIASQPAGADVALDGLPRGQAPLVLTVPAGSHQIVLTAGGARRAAMIALEYGEPQEVTLAMVAGRGTLVVDSNAAGATVTLDGQAVGTTPWRGAVDAGPHTLIVTAPGYTTTERAVEVPADGTAQIQAALGRPVGWVEPPKPERGGGGTFVLESGSYLARGPVFGLAAGYRSSGQHLELSSGFALGGDGFAWALRGRLFALTGPVRPYAVGGLNYGFAGTSTAYAGGGVLLPGGKTAAVRVNYFIEAGYGVGRAGDDTSFAFVPIVGGVSFGR